jgi:dUTP pyrophosphatase
MKLKIKYRLLNPMCEPEVHGDWIDLKVAETTMFVLDEFKIVSLGFIIQLPKYYEANIVPRSSLYKNKLILQTNSFGIVDTAYSGENDIIKFPALSMGFTTLEEGERICQMKVVLTQNAPWWAKIKNLFYSGYELHQVDVMGNPNRGGFGSSGGYNK